MDYTLCQVQQNHGASDLPPSAEYPVLLTFWAPEGTLSAKSKAAEITKLLKEKGHKAKFKSFAAGRSRYCVLATDAPMTTMGDVATRFFKGVSTDVRSMKEHFEAFDQAVYAGMLK